MIIHRFSTLLVILAVAVIALGYVNPTIAAPPNCEPNDHRPSCNDDGGDDGGGNNECQLSFSVAFRDGMSDGILSDGNGVYPEPDSRDKSQATSGGGGFRFDTNGGSQKVNGAGGSRTLKLKHIPVAGYPEFNSGVDFRFHRNVELLNLCDLGQDESSTIPMILLFAATDDVEYKLLFDCISHGGGDFAGSGSPVNVVRTLQQNSAEEWTAGDTWTIDGAQACLITAEDYATGTDNVIASPGASFQMIITALDQ